MNLNVHKLGILVTGCILLAGCASSRRVGAPVTVSSAPLSWVADTAGQLCVKAEFHVPAHTLERRSRLIIVPQVVKDGTVCAELLPVVADGSIYTKKMKRLRKLEHVTDDTLNAQTVHSTAQAFTLPYADSTYLPTSASGAELLAVISTDGCGTCSAIDTLHLGTVTVQQRPVIPPLEVKWQEPEFAVRFKEHRGEAVAHLQFAINRHDIVPSMGRNREELEAIRQRLTPVVTDSLFTLTSLTVCGMASADGSLAFNTTLSHNRALSAKQWLVDELRLDPETERLIRVDSRPEGWQPVYEAMVADHCPDAPRVKEVLDRYADANDDVQERHIRLLPCWNIIKQHYLQKDRKVIYTYRYTIRSFTTDDELVRMYRTRPDAFNLEELLRVATLAATDTDRVLVYEYALRRFPESPLVRNNLAVLYVRTGREAEARRLLKEGGAQ